VLQWVDPGVGGKASISISDSTLAENSVGAHVLGNGALFSGEMAAARNTVMSSGTGIEVLNKAQLVMDANMFYQDPGPSGVYDVKIDSTSTVYSRQNNTVGGLSIQAGGALVPISGL